MQTAGRCSTAYAAGSTSRARRRARPTSRSSSWPSRSARSSRHNGGENRWLNINSFVAYLIFTVLCGGAFYFLYESRTREIVGARDTAAADRDVAAKRANDAQAKLAARDAADAKAYDTWALFEAGKRDDATTHLAELGNAPLSKLDREVLAARSKQAELVQVDAALKTANAQMRAGNFAQVVTTLEAGLKLAGAAPRVGEMNYVIGMAQLRTNELDKAIAHFQAAVAADVGEEDARFQLASTLDKVGQWGKARVEYNRFATAHPQSAFAVVALRRAAILAQFPPTAPWLGKPGGAPPAPVAPKPAATDDGSAAAP